MKKQTWVLVMSIFGLLYALGIVMMLTVGVVFGVLDGNGDLVLACCVIAAALIVLGWFLVPALFSTMDDSLNPERLAPYVGPTHRLAFGLVAATGVGIPGLLTVIVTLLPLLAWVLNGQGVAALLGFVAWPIMLLTAFAWSKVISTWLGVKLRATSTRRDLSSTVATLIFVAVMAPAGLWMQYVLRNFNADMLQKGATISAWTPFGAAYGAVWNYAAGSPVIALLQTIIAIATLIAGLWVWRRVLSVAMSGLSVPVSESAAQAIAEGRHLVDPSRDASGKVLPDGASAASSDSVKSAQASVEEKRYLKGVELWQAVGFSAPTASMAVRTQRYWLSDARIMGSLAMPLILCAMAAVFSMQENTPSFTGQILLYMTPIILGVTIGAIAQYDSTAVWISVSSSHNGRQERLGRLVGSLFVSCVALAVGIGVYAIIRGFGGAPLILLSVNVLTLLLTASIAALVVGSVFVYPVQPPGVSPMSAKGTGNMMMTMILQFGAMLAGGIVGAPVLVVSGLASFEVLPVWAAIVAAVVWLPVVCIGGVLWSGRLWDRYAVDVLSTIRDWPGH